MSSEAPEQYIAHNGEQMDFETAFQRCPFLQSFGETALQEIRQELDTYRAPTPPENIPEIVVTPEKTDTARPVQEGLKEEIHLILHEQTKQPDTVQTITQPETPLASVKLIKQSKPPTPHSSIRAAQTKIIREKAVTPPRTSIVSLPLKLELVIPSVTQLNLETVAPLPVAEIISQTTPLPTPNHLIEQPLRMTPLDELEVTLVDKEVFEQSFEDPELFETTMVESADTTEEHVELEAVDDSTIEINFFDSDALVDEVGDVVEARILEAPVEVLDEIASIVEQLEVSYMSTKSAVIEKVLEITLDPNQPETTVAKAQLVELQHLCETLVKQLDLPIESAVLHAVLKQLVTPESYEHLSSLFELYGFYNQGTHEFRLDFRDQNSGLGKYAKKILPTIISLVGSHALRHFEWQAA